jgi:hypothetical protein
MLTQIGDQAIDEVPNTTNVKTSPANISDVKFEKASNKKFSKMM